MANVTVTILQSGRCDDWGRPYVVGSRYSVEFNEARGLWQAGFASVADPAIFDDSSTPADGGIPKCLGFPGFKRCLLASLVNSSTASRSNGLVTISATSHGITTGATYQGVRFFYPGSPDLAAGWYDSIVSIPDANTLTFSAPGPDFGSQSINSGTAYTTLTDLASVVLPGYLIVPDTHISVIGYSGGDTTATTKQIRTYLNNLNVHTHGVTTTPFVRFTAASVAVVGGKSYGHSGFDNLSSVTEYLQNLTLGADATLTVKGSVTAAGAFLHVPSLKVLLT